MFAPYAVYTILHRDRLDAIAKSGKTAQLNETKRWVTGRALHIEAQKQGEDMVILYGDASHCSDLLYWGRLTEIQIDANGTRYTVADLSALSLKKTQELVLQSTNRRIAKGFIKPYAIVKTPAFIDRRLKMQHASASSGLERPIRSFTQYWKQTTSNWHDERDQKLTRASSNRFKSRGVQPGDKIFIVGILDSEVHLGGFLVVDKLVGFQDARKQFGETVWDATDHVIAREPQTFYKDLIVPMETIRALRFEGDKALVFSEPGKLDTQTLRGLRELTDESAEMLQSILEAQEAGDKEPAGQSLLDLSEIGRLFGDELVLELAILRRSDLSETEKQSLVMARRGQAVFRNRVVELEGRCRLTGVDQIEHLRASHIKPWKDSSDLEKLDGNNGLLLAPHVDHLFDRGFISFSDCGDILVSQGCESVLSAWGISTTMNVEPFRVAQRPFLRFHRRLYGFEAEASSRKSAP